MIDKSMFNHIIGLNSPHRRLARNLVFGFAIFATVSFAFIAIAAVAISGLFFQPLLALASQLPNLLSGSSSQVWLPVSALEALNNAAILTNLNSAIDLFQQQYLSGEAGEGEPGGQDATEAAESGEVAGESVQEL
ncbi:MAG: hypothetical protein N2691_02415 [Patescibacteria group bacterium]|nr:hypothetical protein [Patescibacteria group bacterium]